MGDITIYDQLLWFSPTIHRLVIPAFETFNENITEIYHKLKLNNAGEPDPFLKKVIDHFDDSTFGISICTVDGQRFSIGDATKPFSLQSLCRPITYGIGKMHAWKNMTGSLLKY